MFSRYFTNAKPTIAELEKHLTACVDQGRCTDITELFEEAGRCGYGANECRDMLSKVAAGLTGRDEAKERPQFQSEERPSSISGPTGMRRLKGDKLVAALRKLREEQATRQALQRER